MRRQMDPWMIVKLSPGMMSVWTLVLHPKNGPLVFASRSRWLGNNIGSGESRELWRRTLGPVAEIEI